MIRFPTFFVLTSRESICVIFLCLSGAILKHQKGRARSSFLNSIFNYTDNYLYIIYTLHMDLTTQIVLCYHYEENHRFSINTISRD